MIERALTVKGVATRSRIIEGAASEDFPAGRSQLLLAVAQHEADRVLSEQQPHLDDLTSWRRWEDWRDQVVERYGAQGQSCPLSVLVSQLGPSEPAIRAVVVDLLEGWQERITRGIRSMQTQGKVAVRLDAQRSAAALLVGHRGHPLPGVGAGRRHRVAAPQPRVI